MSQPGSASLSGTSFTKAGIRALLAKETGPSSSSPYTR